MGSKACFFSNQAFVFGARRPKLGVMNQFSSAINVASTYISLTSISFSLARALASTYISLTSYSFALALKFKVYFLYLKGISLYLSEVAHLLLFLLTSPFFLMRADNHPVGNPKRKV
jgi:hypothetical protein